MKITTICAACTLLLLLSACETKEEFQARRNQFNGQTVAEVSGKIGRPVKHDTSKAVWETSTTYYDREPIERCYAGRCVTIGYITEEIVEKCTFTATLMRGRITSSDFKGAICGALSPRLKKP